MEHGAVVCTDTVSAGHGVRQRVLVILSDAVLKHPG